MLSCMTELGPHSPALVIKIRAVPDFALGALAGGDERHFMLECPQFDDICAQYPDLLQHAHDSTRNLMWHQNQKALSDFVIAILDEPRP